MLDKLRVVLANMPQILKLILRDLVNRQPDMAIVGEVRMLAELPDAITASGAQAVILTLSPPSPGPSFCQTLRARHPALTLVGLALHHDRAVMWPPQTGPRPIEMSGRAILGALRDFRKEG